MSLEAKKYKRGELVLKRFMKKSIADIRMEHPKGSTKKLKRFAFRDADVLVDQIAGKFDLSSKSKRRLWKLADVIINRSIQ